MADFEATRSPVMSVPPPSLVSTTVLVYALFTIGAIAGMVSSGFPLVLPLVGFLGIAGVVLAYVKRGDAEGSWLASHYHWLIRTFWFSLVWGIIGGVFFVTLIGIPLAFVIWFAATVWVIYRLIRGWVLFKDNKAIPRM
jgi:uncharacterized membrane protein